MIICPKCLSYRIAGPSFENEGFGERLRYRCVRCGYSETRETANADRYNKAVDDANRMNDKGETET